VADVLDDFALVVEGLKLKVLVQLGLLAAELAATTGAAFLTFGVAEAAAPEEIVATQGFMRWVTSVAIQKVEHLVAEKVAKKVVEHFLSIKNGLKALKASRTALKDFGKGIVKGGEKDLEHAGAHTPTTAVVPWREWPEKDGFFGGYSRTYVLKPATRVDRLGSRDGRFVSPLGTPFKARGLPSSRAGDDHIAYEVVRRLPVRKGLVAPWKDSAGFGIQYHLPAGAQDLVDAGYLKVLKP
jgi:Tuberculosis necrotizing toxin